MGGAKGWEKGGSACGSDSRSDSTGVAKPGDWVCPNCNNVNFSHRDKCNKCGTPSKGQARLGMKPGDWICPKCGDLVFASKSQCKMCQTPKPDEERGFHGAS